MTLLEYPKIEPVTGHEKRPFWSIMIPTYNNFQYLEQALQSILEQDEGPEEMQIEVIDDCSTENPEQIVRNIGKGRVNFYRNQTNLGIGGNWNTCLQRSRGQWVHILHQDDLVLAGFYQKFRQTLEQQEEVGAAFCRNIYIDENNNWKYLSLPQRTTPGILENWIEKIAVECPLNCAAIVVKRSVYENLGGFDIHLLSALDWDMWKRITLSYKIWYEPEPLACYRWHQESTSSYQIISGYNIADGRKSIELARLFLPKELAQDLTQRALEHYAMFALHLAEGLLKSGQFPGAVAQIQEGLKCSKSPKVLERLIQIISSPQGQPVLELIADFLENISWE